MDKPQKKERRYRGEQLPSADLEASSKLEGIFQGMRMITLQDQNTKQDKEVRQYTFRDDKGGRFVLLGRTMLDNAFDLLFEAEGGLEGCQGLNLRIERGADSRLSRGRTMGNYEIVVIQ